MRLVRGLVATFVVALALLITSSGGRAQGPSTQFVGIGDVGGGGINSIVQEATQWQSVIALVEAGMGVSIAPECVAKFSWPGVVYRTLLGVNTKVYAGWIEDAPASAKTFLRMTRPKTAHDHDFEKEYRSPSTPRSQP